MGLKRLVTEHLSNVPYLKMIPINSITVEERLLSDSPLNVKIDCWFVTIDICINRKSRSNID